MQYSAVQARRRLVISSETDVNGYSRSYIPVVYCLNKIDSISIEELDLLYRIPNAVPISSEHGWNIDELMEAMWEKLNLKRVYTKPKGRAPDYSAPVVLRSNRSTVEDFVRNLPHFPAFYVMYFVVAMAGPFCLQALSQTRERYSREKK